MSFENFTAVNSSEPSFMVTATTVASLTALESTATNRYWQGAPNRLLRITSASSADTFATFGSSLSVATSSGATLFLSGLTNFVFIEAQDRYISVVTTSTSGSNMNVTLGKRIR